MIFDITAREFFIVLGVGLLLMWDFGATRRKIRRSRRRRKREQELRVLREQGFDF